jgi:hypothetical protein
MVKATTKDIPKLVLRLAYWADRATDADWLDLANLKADCDGVARVGAGDAAIALQRPLMR